MTTVSTPERDRANANQAVLRDLLKAQPELEFAVLVGSQANGTATPASDWDIALQWQRDIDWFTQLDRTETLRRQRAAALDATESRVDLIDVPRASLAMRAVVAEEGRVLKGEDELPWQRFLRRTWRELEEYYWEQIYADRSLPS